MDNLQDPLFTPLQTPPLKRQGFTDALRRSIEDRIAELDRASSVRPLWVRLFPAGGALLAVAIAAVLFVGDWIEPTELTSSSNGAATHYQAQEAKVEALVPDVRLRSGLLIGLRGGESEYRTLWIAPIKNELRLVAHGAGLLVPYRLDFWKLEAVPASGEEGSFNITARIAAAKRNERLSEPDAATRDSEVAPDTPASILFAAQQYVALQLGKPPRQTNVVTTLSEIARGSLTSLPLSKLTDEPLDEASREITNIAVRREQGSWRLVTGADKAGSDYRFSSAVLRHDGACANWEEIEFVEPEALDAVCSPTADVVAVLTPDELHLYPQSYRIVTERRLTVPLRKDEKIVMTEWATDDYIEKWNDLTAEYLH